MNLSLKKAEIIVEGKCVKGVLVLVAKALLLKNLG